MRLSKEFKLQTGQTGRLAFRVEGDTWRAYYALPNTMEGAIPLASIHMTLVTANSERREEFIELMRRCVGDLLEIVTGKRPDGWNEPESAPESERSGTA